MTFDEWWEQTPPDFHIGNYTEEQMCKIAWEAALSQCSGSPLTLEEEQEEDVFDQWEKENLK